MKEWQIKEDGEPKTRPLCSASTCINGRLSDVVSDILTPVAIAEGEEECLSSEEMLYHIGEATKVILVDGKNVVVASEDVDGLFPNLEIMSSAILCGNAVRATKVKFEGIDYIWASKYIAMTCSQQEIEDCGFQDIVPRRKSKKGTRPTIVGVDIEEKVSKWSFSKTNFDDKEKKELMAKVIEIAVKTTFLV